MGLYFLINFLTSKVFFKKTLLVELVFLANTKSSPRHFYEWCVFPVDRSNMFCVATDPNRWAESLFWIVTLFLWFFGV